MFMMSILGKLVAIGIVISVVWLFDISEELD